MKNMKRLILSMLMVIMVCCSIGCAEKASMTTYNQQSNTKVINDDSPQELIFTVGDVSFTMKKVEGGTFLMGSGESDDEPIRKVTLDSYYIGETEVTQALWRAVMGNNPSRFIGDNRPVEQVSWNDCQIFIQKINLLTGKNFRLPTEAEWEYAARGGKRSRGYKYAGSNIVDNVAVYEVNSKNMGEGSRDYGTHMVKSKQANELGLYDMSGNVWEWCNDYYNENFNDRVLRGGRWNASAYHCRVTRRIWDYPNSNYYGSGFRLVLDP